MSCISSGQIDVLKEEITGLEARFGQVTRKNKVAEAEMGSLRSQLLAKDKELIELRSELQASQAAPVCDSHEEQVQAKRISDLTAEVS